MTEIISSIKNPELKYLRKLYRSRNRRKEGKFILEGTRIVEHALGKGNYINKVFIGTGFEDSILINKIKQQNIAMTTISDKLLSEVSDTISPQGIIAIANKPEYQLADIFQREGCILLLDQIQDPGNMGSLIRTAVAAGAAGIIALKGCVDIYNLKVLRATMGAVFNLPICTRISPNIMEEEEVQLNYDIVCTDLNTEQYYYQPQYNRSTLFVIGNEARGVSDNILSQADYRVKIPLKGEIDSLNAAVSGGIILYEFLKQQEMH